MRRNWYSSVLVLCAFLFGVALVPGASWAQEVTPAATPTPLPEFCTEEQIAAGDSSIDEWPRGGAVVNPTSSPGMDLYVVEVILPTASCVSFTGHYLHDGAVIWLVKSGQVQFAFQPIDGWPAPDVMWEMQSPDPGATDWTATLNAGDWVSADRAVDYSYLAVSGGEDGNAVVIMTVLEKRVPYDSGAQSAYDSGGRCKGVCRR